MHAGYKPDDSYVLAKKNVEYKTNKDKTDQDAGITRDLESQGYKVLRLWASDLLFDTETCRQKIVDAVRKSLE